MYDKFCREYCCARFDGTLNRQLLVDARRPLIDAGGVQLIPWDWMLSDWSKTTCSRPPARRCDCPRSRAPPALMLL
jgi:hypothetical protein